MGLCEFLLSVFFATLPNLIKFAEIEQIVCNRAESRHNQAAASEHTGSRNENKIQ